VQVNRAGQVSAEADAAGMYDHIIIDL